MQARGLGRHWEPARARAGTAAPGGRYRQDVVDPGQHQDRGEIIGQRRAGTASGNRIIPPGPAGRSTDFAYARDARIIAGITSPPAGHRLAGACQPVQSGIRFIMNGPTRKKNRQAPVDVFWGTGGNSM